MSSWVATMLPTLRWKECRLDLPGHAALQACRQSPDEHNDVQKKTFTKWINARFSKLLQVLVRAMLWCL
uniref:Uncharacterized protein n=1 Tax=Castor canadensis TaxID=51338 RepID=A0A8C0XEP5_CASCN